VPPVAREQLVQWYRSADLVAVPSYNETFGLVALAGHAGGTPAVAAAVGGLPTALGDAGVLVPDHETRSWSTALEGLLDDDARRRDLAARGVAHASQLGWEHTTDQLLEVYAEALAARHATPVGS